MRLYAVQTKFLVQDDNTWHRHTTKWYPKLSQAWEEKEKYERMYGKTWLESTSSALRKEE